MLVIGVRGRLKSMSLPVLLRWASADRKTGVLVIDRGPISKKIYFRTGTIVSSSSNDPREYLGQFLMSHGYINEDQLRQAMEMQRKSRMMIGKLLLEAKVIDQGDLKRLLAKKAEETIYSLFLWEEGEFQFLEGEILRKSEVPISLKVEKVLLEGNRRYEKLREIRMVFPSDQVVLARTERPLPGKEGSQPMVRRAHSLIDGRRTISDICLEMRAPEFSVSWILLQLVRKEFLKFASDAAAKRPSQDQAITVVIKQARGLLARSDFESALLLLEQVRAENPGNTEVPRLIQKAEDGFTETVYRDVLPRNEVPVLTRPLKQLMAEDLSSEEGFIVSRLTGEMDVESLVSISPLREVDVLRTLKRLREKELIGLRRNGSNGHRKEAPAGPRPAFDRKGWAVAWVKENVVFDREGIARAFIKSGGVFRFDGTYLGHYGEGFFRDRTGDCIAFMEGACGGPVLPGLVPTGPPPGIPRVPLIPLDEIAAPEPATPSLGWSGIEFDAYLSGR